ncbi:MAG: helix-turn-helix domain-containing protein [Turicibacter sp.]|nr:helix-turn-helix domain-containing protein [Turicibacter sp.]
MKFDLEQARKYKKITQKELANLLGVSEATYISWEKNPDNVRVGYAKQIASILGISYDVIFFGNELQFNLN